MICKICLKKSYDFNLINLVVKQPICNKCLNEMKPIFYSFRIGQKYKALAIYKYNQKIREMIYLLKGAFDYEISKYFLYHYKEFLSLKYAGFVVVFAPSRKEDDEERGFNHVEAIFNVLKLEKLKILYKTERRKQSDQTKEEKEKIKDYLGIKDIDLSNKKILLVDDVYTTGSTIKACLSLLEKQKAKKIAVLLVSKKD